LTALETNKYDQRLSNVAFEFSLTALETNKYDERLSNVAFEFSLRQYGTDKQFSDEVTRNEILGLQPISWLGGL